MSESGNVLAFHGGLNLATGELTILGSRHVPDEGMWWRDPPVELTRAQRKRWDRASLKAVAGGASRNEAFARACLKVLPRAEEWSGD